MRHALEEIVEYLQRVFLIAVTRYDDARRIVARDHLRNGRILCVKTQNGFFETESVRNFISHAVRRRAHFGHDGVTILERVGEMCRWHFVLRFQEVLYQKRVDVFVLASTGKRAGEVDVQAALLRVRRHARVR